KSLAVRPGGRHDCHIRRLQFEYRTDASHSDLAARPDEVFAAGRNLLLAPTGRTFIQGEPLHFGSIEWFDWEYDSLDDKSGRQFLLLAWTKRMGNTDSCWHWLPLRILASNESVA